MAVMKAAPSAFTSTATLSPTATGLVLRMPFSLKLPLILQLCTVPSSASTTYQLPVFRITNPYILICEYPGDKVTQIYAHQAICALIFSEERASLPTAPTRLLSFYTESIPKSKKNSLIIHFSDVENARFTGILASINRSTA